MKAQYTMSTKVVLPLLELKDDVLMAQLDSILFEKHPCGNSRDDKYNCFLWIEEAKPEEYSFVIVYAKASEVENDINTGVYKLNDRVLIIREDSENPLFLLSRRKYTFSYRKELMKKSSKSNELEERLDPEEFCIWSLLYSNKKLKVTDLVGL